MDEEEYLELLYAECDKSVMQWQRDMVRSRLLGFSSQMYAFGVAFAIGKITGQTKHDVIDERLEIYQARHAPKKKVVRKAIPAKKPLAKKKPLRKRARS